MLKVCVKVFKTTEKIFKECSDKMEQIYKNYPEKTGAVQTGLKLSGCKLEFIERSNQAFEEAFDEFMKDELPTLCYVSMAELDSIVSEVRKQFESFQKDFFFQLNMSMERFLWQEQIDNPDEVVLNREPIGDGNEIVKTVDRYADKLFKAD